jgi:dTDP-4-amino-4,6-dideoxygalactose transaminase
MYIVGQEEIDAIARIIKSGALFRYGADSECERFEQRYAKYLGSRHFALAASGSNALAAAMIGVGLGPGDEVLIPAHTYMATATSVLAVGAIPVIVDIDETLTIDPKAVEAAIRPRTKAVVPVHMWGAACDMAAIMDIARRRNPSSSRMRARASAAATRAGNSAPSATSGPSASTSSRT